MIANRRTGAKAARRCPPRIRECQRRAGAIEVRARRHAARQTVRQAWMGWNGGETEIAARRTGQGVLTTDAAQPPRRAPGFDGRRKRTGSAREPARRGSMREYRLGAAGGGA